MPEPLDIPKAVADYLGYDIEPLWQHCRVAPFSYRRFLIKKTAGGHRAIYHPSRQTKAIQYALINVVLNKLPVHRSAYAYMVGRSIVSNALAHVRYTYSVRVDFSNFFPSIRPVDVLSRIAQLPGGSTPASAEFVTSALFVEYKSGQKGLAVGAPSSPAASNAVMIDIDTALTAFALARGGCYTRYADDVVFSTNSKGECRNFVEEIHRTLAQTSCPKLRLNHKKTSYGSRGSRRVVTGLVVTPDERISLGRHAKRFLRKLLFDLGRNALDEKSTQYLRGYLAFALSVEPDLLNKLALRYGAELLNRARRGGEPPATMTAAAGRGV